MDSQWTLDKVRHAPVNGADPFAAAAGGHGDEIDSSNRFAPYKRVHRLLRGRYHLLVPGIVIAMVAGGIYGWHKATPEYRSEGLIQVADKLPTVVAPTEDTGEMEMFEEFVQSQVLLISSRSVIAQAMNDPAFKAATKNRYDINVETFLANLVVEHPPRTQAIDITFVDPDPNVAAKAVQALIAAFMDISSRSNNVLQDKRLALLQQRKDTLTDQINAITKQLSQVQAPSLGSIAMVDDNMRSMLDQHNAIEGQLDDYIAAGYGANRPQVQSARQRLDEVDAKILAYQKDVTAMQAATAAVPSTDRHVPMLPGFLPYTENIDALRKERDQVEDRIDVLTTESSLGAERFHVMSDGDTPSIPYADRRPRMAAMFAIAAASIPVFLCFLLGLADRRFRFSEDAADVVETAPLLGVLPELPKLNGYADLNRIAAYCVHNLRIRLQLLPGKKGDRVYMITSATAGEGKTSLTLALGMSFAASGKKVLLVDADLIGRGLTNRLKCEGLPGLLESVNGAGLEPVRVVMPNISILPAGNAGSLGIGTSLPLDQLHEVIGEARSRFDLIIMDTGPVVASLQTPIVAQVADHVILTVSQGLQQVLCHRSMQILRSVGIKVTGIVFNRARERDYRRWIGGDSYYASSPSSEWNSIPGDQPAEYGPLAGSIAEVELAPSIAPSLAPTNGVG